MEVEPYNSIRATSRPVLIEFGRVGKPHGFRGDFLTFVSESTATVLSQANEIYLGTQAESAVPHRLVEAAWMPKGWKLRIEGIGSDAQVKELKGTSLFLDRSLLPPIESGEFYLADLAGCEVLEEPTGKRVGAFEGAEPVGTTVAAPDRWWIRTEADRLAVPAVKHFISKVDTEKKQIWLKNLSDLE